MRRLVIGALLALGVVLALSACQRLDGVIDVAAGEHFSCSLHDDGTVRCWGDGSLGQLGDGTTVSSEGPVRVSGISSATAVTAGDQHACAVLAGGTARCWGANGSGQLGDGTTTDRTTPVVVSGLSTVVAIDAGRWHTCAVLADGSARCWGDGWAGQLGDGGTAASTTPVVVSGITDATVVSAGSTHSCAVLADGGARCWGINDWGQLGDGSEEPSLVPVTVTGAGDLFDVVDVSVGYSHSCAVLADGTVRCWGHNPYGELGTGTEGWTSVPVEVPGVTGAVAVDASGEHNTCTVLADGTGRCWGDNSFGQLGDGTTGTGSGAPIPVLDLADATTIAISSDHACARVGDGTARCWGSNGGGEVGDHSGVPQRETPVAVLAPQLVGSVAETVSGADHTCARATAGTVSCWGDNLRGQLGDGTTTDRPHPTTVPGITTASALAAGDRHTCALLTDTTVRCWGNDNYGQLGTGTTHPSGLSTPTEVPGLTGVTGITAGWGHTCAVLTDDTARCWGYNADGAVGDGTTTHRSSPTAVSGLTGAVEISARYSHTCARLGTGALRCWGLGAYGQLGDGTEVTRLTPVAVTGITDAVALTAGGYHTCAVLSGGTAKCWGNNGMGQIGDGTTTFRTTPVVVTGLAGATSITGGHNHTCATLADDTVRCWGFNSVGQVGDGSAVQNVLTPAAVADLSAVASLDAGLYHGCAVLDSGTMRCWGRNTQAQLGDGTTANRSTPVGVVSDR
jgi:alpha-tubulin suppressor-like RCC1 family protein